MEQHPLYRFYIDLNDKVNKLSNQTPSTSVGGSMDLSDVMVRLDKLESKLALEGVVYELSASVKLLKEENAQLKSDLERLNKLDNLEARVYKLEVEPKVDLAPVNDRLTNLENTNYNDRLNTTEAKLTSVEQYVNSISDLTYRVGEVEKRPELSQRLSAIETIVANLHT